MWSDWKVGCSDEAGLSEHTLPRSICFHLCVTSAVQQVVVQMEAGVSLHTRSWSPLIPHWETARHPASLTLLQTQFHLPHQGNSFTSPVLTPALLLNQSTWDNIPSWKWKTCLLTGGSVSKLIFLQEVGQASLHFQHLTWYFVGTICCDASLKISLEALLSLMIGAFSHFLCMSSDSSPTVFVASLLSLFLKSFSLSENMSASQRYEAFLNVPWTFSDGGFFLIMILFIFLHGHWLKCAAPHILCHLIFLPSKTLPNPPHSFSSLLFPFSQIPREITQLHPLLPAFSSASPFPQHHPDLSSTACAGQMLFSPRPRPWQAALCPLVPWKRPFALIVSDVPTGSQRGWCVRGPCFRPEDQHFVCHTLTFWSKSYLSLLWTDQRTEGVVRFIAFLFAFLSSWVSGCGLNSLPVLLCLCTCHRLVFSRKACGNTQG